MDAHFFHNIVRYAVPKYKQSDADSCEECAKAKNP